MRPTPSESEVLAALKTFAELVGEATQFWYSAAALNEAAIVDPKLFQALQTGAGFWNTVRGGLEMHAIVAVGRILGERGENARNIDWFREVILNGSAHLSPSAHEARKCNAASGRESEGFLPRDIDRLRFLVKKYKGVYQDQFRDIRNSIAAHSGGLTAAEREVIYGKTRIRDFERALRFLNGLHDAVWQMYYNGRRFGLRSSPASVRRLARTDISTLDRAKNIEFTVIEARKALAIYLQGASSQ